MSRKRRLELELKRGNFSEIHSWAWNLGRAKFDFQNGARLSFRNAACSDFCIKHKVSGLDLEISSPSGVKNVIARLTPCKPQTIIDFSACTLQSPPESTELELDLEIVCGCNVSVAGEYTGHLTIS